MRKKIDHDYKILIVEFDYLFVSELQFKVIITQKLDIFFKVSEFFLLSRTKIQGLSGYLGD